MYKKSVFQTDWSLKLEQNKMLTCKDIKLRFLVLKIILTANGN